MKITNKLKLLFAVNATLILIVVLFGMSKMNTIGVKLENVAEHDIPLIELLSEVTIGQLEQTVLLEQALRISGIGHHDPSKFDKLVNQFVEVGHHVDEEVVKAEALVTEVLSGEQSDEMADKFHKIEKQLHRINEQHHAYEEHVLKSIELIKAGNLSAAEELALKSEQEQLELEKELESMLLEVEKFTEQAAMDAEHEERSGIIGMLVISVVSFVLGLALSFWVNKTINTSLTSIIAVISEISSNKNLKLRVKEGKDELGEMGGHFNNMMGSIQEVVTEVSSASTQLATAAEELSAITAHSNESVQSQKNEMDQSATAMNEMTASMREVATSAANVAKAVTDADRESNESRRIVDTTSQSIQQLAKDVDQASEVIQNLATDSESIGTVLVVIKEIADQTNLLALNAAIEAARAGEQGRGFAVVADEVRTLAQRTQESTDKIQSTIEKLQSRAQEAVNVMEAGRNQAENSVEHTSDTQVSLTTIIEAITQINDMATHIASAAEEQSAVSEEINRSIVKINDVASEVSEGAKQTDVASGDIAQLASGLQGMVAQFKL
jgi:methyl-accepting chemotaxis protein